MVFCITDQFKDPLGKHHYCGPFRKFSVYVRWVLCLSLVSIVFNQQATAQKINFDYITIKNGLSQNTVRGLVKDKYGFMWFGTWNGLCRYDGYRIKVYRTIPGDSTSITNNRIHQIYKDGQGDLWVATFNASVCRYNYETDNFTRFKWTEVDPSIINGIQDLRSLSAFKANEVLLNTIIGPFQMEANNAQVVFKNQPAVSGGLNDIHASSFYKDDNNILWLGTIFGGVNKIDLNNKPFTVHPVFEKDSRSRHLPVRTVLADERGVWVGTEKGLVLVDAKTKQEKRYDKELPGFSIRALFKDSYGDIWIGSLFGIDKLEANTGRIIHYYNNTVDSSFNTFKFFGIAEDPVDQSIWITSENTILRFDRKKSQLEKLVLDSYLPANGGGCIFFDSRKNIWIGTETGLIHVQRNAQTGAIVQVKKYSGADEKATIPGERVYSIAEDGSGNIWVGTANGLFKIRHSTLEVKKYSRADGLPDFYITRLLPDKAGNIWIAHKSGLSKLTTGTDTIRNYVVEETQRGYEFVDGSGTINPVTGELYFGGMEGFVSFHPAAIKDNPFIPPVVLTELQVLNNPVAIGVPVNGHIILSRALHLTKKIKLHHDDRSFSIEFAALHYASPDRNQYAYMLEGVDEKWIYTDASRRFATYANLSAGTYFFKVRASNSDGVWNETPTVLEIQILPPWWKTGWAYTIYTILIAALLYLIYRVVKARYTYMQQILRERLKAEKASELEQLKSNFFTNVSHEFRTPLTLIIDPLDTLIAEKVPEEKALGYYSIMRRNAARLLALINQFLDFRKIESGNLQLRATRQDLVAYLKNTVAAFEYKAQQKKIQLQFEANQPSIVMGFDTDIIEKILYNLLSNAFKFTPENGIISVSLSAASAVPDEVMLTVKDTGIGIPADMLTKVFEPFYQVDGGKHSTGGTGVGLSLTKELAILHKGKVEAQSVPGQETTFRVWLGNIAGAADASIDNDKEDEYSEDAGMPALSTATEANTSDPVVLIVEDNDDVRAYLKSILSAHYQVLEASDGLGGSEIALHSLPDLVISDVMMPEMDGLQFCRLLKTDERTSHIPVILLTARQSEQYQVDGYETGADDYVAKPFSSVLLLARIRNLLQSRQKLRALFNQSNGFDTRLVTTNPADKAFTEKLTALIDENMGNDDFDVEWLAAHMFLSRTQLYRKIKGLTNQTVHEFITTIRLRKAAELLLQGQLQVVEVAYAVGYADSTSFGRAFQKQYGVTPKKYQ